MATSALLRIKAKLGKRRRNNSNINKDEAVSLPVTERVLNTYELLEGILDQLDPYSLRKAQLVCPAWNDTIVHSTRLSASRDSGLDRKFRVLRLGLVGAQYSGKTALYMKWTLSMYTDMMYDVRRPGDDPGQRKVLHFDHEQWAVELMAIKSPISRGNPVPPASLPASILWTPRNLQFLESNDAYVLVYSVTDRTAFERLRLLAANLKMVVAEQEKQQQQQEQQQPHLLLSKGRPAKQRPLALIATKCDLESLISGEWEVTHEEGVTLAAELGCPFHETSARSGEGVDECFDGVMREYKKARMRIIRDKSDIKRHLASVWSGVGDRERTFDEILVEEQGRSGRKGRRRSEVWWDKRKLGLVARKFRSEKTRE